MRAALSKGKRRFSKRLKNAQEKPAALPVSSPQSDPLPALAESVPGLTGYNQAISGPESVFPQVEPLPHTLQRPPPFPPTPADAHQKSLNVSNKTFRLRGIDHKWDHDRVKREVKVAFDLSDAALIHVRSISPDPSDSKRKIATLELSEIPNGISHANRPSEWMPHAAEEDLVLDTNFFGLTPLHETDDAECTLNVIAVPGLNGHAFGSFKAKSRGRTYMWLRDSLAKDLPHARIFIYGYDTQLQGSHSFENIGDLALKLQYAINVVLNNENMNTVRSTVIIGHSLGGIIIKEALKKMLITQSPDRANVESIQGLLFFGVPNQGMAIESLVPMVNNQPNRQLLETLNQNSDVLRHVIDEFITLFKSSHVKVVSFYETEESPTATQIDGIWSMSGPPAILVNRHSATQGWRSEEDIVVPVKATHSGMVKLENKFDEPYGTVLKHLRNVVEKAKVCIRELSHSENECLKSLSFPTQDTRQENVHTAHGTCDWLLRHPVYSQWSSAHRQLLWINGKPGAGKSTLMKYLSNTLINDESSNDYILASFFIDGQGEEMQRSKLGILRSLLHQILRQLPEHLFILTKKFLEREKIRRDWAWSQEELMDVLRNIAMRDHQESHPVIILVDALDELGENLAREVVSFLGTLIGQPLNEQTSTTSANQTYVGMRICFSSRHYPDVTPPDCLSICVEKNNSADIAKFIHEKLSVPRLSSSKAPEDSNSEALEDLIIKKADGVFQWVMLVVEQILKPLAASKKASALRMMVEMLPSELAPLYSRILKNPSLETFQLLQWICFSRGPLGLFELRQALVLSTAQNYTSLEDYEKQFDYQLNEEKVHEMVKHLSRGLIEVKQNLPNYYEAKVGFIHQSVHDYLMNDGLLQVARGCGIATFLDPAKQDSAHLEAYSNAHIAAACIKFFQSKEVRENLVEGKLVSFFDLQTRLALGEYAAKNWLPHMTQSLIDHSLPEFLLELLLSSVEVPVPPVEMRYMGVLVPDLWPSPIPGCSCEYSERFGDILTQRYFGEGGLKTMLHCLVAARSYPILNILTKSGKSLDTRDEKGRTPLMEAILAADIKATALLLDSGLADVNCEDEQHQTPLHHAATDLLSLDIFALLLEKKTIACDAADRRGSTPLLRCLESETCHSWSCSQRSVVDESLLQATKWLLNRGRVNPNRRDEKGNSALAYAARNGYSAIVKLLINRPNVEINSRNERGETPIFQAVRASQTETFTLLFENEHTLLDLEDYSGRSLLSHGAESMEPQDVDKLVQIPNVGLDKQENSLRTPLSYSACRSGDLAQILLDTKGVDPFVRDKIGRSPVSYAASYVKNDNDAFERLWKFDNESNRWNESDSEGRTPLSYAAQYNPTAVKLLLGSPQIARNESDSEGRTPLSYAAQYNPTAVRLLLDSPQIARNEADLRGFAPLDYAVRGRNLEALRYLISDSKVNKSPTFSKDKILHLAVQSKDVTLVGLLIQAGWDVNEKDTSHQTPLFYVCDIETAHILLNTEGIDLEVRDRNGRTALFWIAKNRCPEVVRLLIEDYGFDDQVED